MTRTLLLKSSQVPELRSISNGTFTTLLAPKVVLLPLRRLPLLNATTINADIANNRRKIPETVAAIATLDPAGLNSSLLSLILTVEVLELLQASMKESPVKWH